MECTQASILKEMWRLSTRLMLLLLCGNFTLAHATEKSIVNLKLAYPQYVSEITSNYIAWHDGTRMQIGGSSLLMNWFRSKSLKIDKTSEMITDKDVVHARFEPFFKKMYGKSPRGGP